MPETWDDKFEYLNASRPLCHNEDYWQFLVHEVWRLNEKSRRVVDFGCGFGRVAMLAWPQL